MKQTSNNSYYINSSTISHTENEEFDEPLLRQVIRHMCNIIFKLHTSEYTSNTSIINRYKNYKLTEEDRYWVDQYTALCIPENNFYLPSLFPSQIVPLPSALDELVQLANNWVI